VVDANITFRDAAFAPTTVAANAKYVQCQHTQPSVQMWLLKAMGAFSGNTADYPTSNNVTANAVATRASAQSTCPIPIAFKPPAGGTKANNYLLQIGQWVKVIGDKVPNSGEIGWYNLDGSTSANAAKEELEGGSCGNKVGDTLGTPGAKNAVNTVWNYRFGIYSGSGDPSVNHPDFSGYSYTSFNWKNAVPQNAWDGTPAAGSAPGAANFVTKRAAFASFDDTGTNLKHGSLVTFGDQNKLNSFQRVASPGSGGQHAQFGADRRLATVPVIDGSNRVTDYICMFMLHPLTGPTDDAFVEFRGNAGAAGSPCTTVGFPGGAAGPLVPALVR
jgi:hypothetical protein